MRNERPESINKIAFLGFRMIDFDYWCEHRMIYMFEKYVLLGCVAIQTR